MEKRQTEPRREPDERKSEPLKREAGAVRSVHQAAQGIGVWAAGAPIGGLSSETLYELAAVMGNSAMRELMGGGGVETVPFPYVPRTVQDEQAETPVNEITTSLPELTDPSGLRGERMPGRPFAPHAIRDRADAPQEANLFAYPEVSLE